ncbi:MAG: aminotransferase class III-fold pyridoxal phosphate-dependent enzyme [Armatimonadia bacterium]|nr:aminotransferase class III-fold pyridoxal phosphate-dependent enzyme [Armatimonadia bacterium]
MKMPKYDLPGPKSAEYIEMSDRYEGGATGRQQQFVWDHAEGCTIWDVDGNEYIDWTSGVLVTNVGHCHPHHVEAIQNQVGRLMCPYDFPTPERVTLAKRMVEVTPENLDACFMITTGSEATEAAMRMAKRFTGKHEIISFYGGFHGRTGMAMASAGKQGTKYHYGPVLTGHVQSPYAYCYRCPFDLTPDSCDFKCLRMLDLVVKTQTTGNIAAVITEPYQGGAGFIFPPEGWLTELQNWCREHEVMFILDEVQSSFGRTGKMFAAEHEGLSPDFMPIGKGIGSGIPTSCLMTEQRIMEAFDRGEASSTTGGNPVSCAAAHAVLDIFEEENLVENSAKIGEYMKDRLQAMQEKSPYVGDVRGMGLVMGIEFVSDKETKEPAPDIMWDVIDTCATEGLCCGMVGFHGNVIRVAPPLVISQEEAEQSCDIMESVVLGLD